MFRLFVELRLALKARDASEVERLGTEMEKRSRNMFSEIHALDAFGKVDDASPQHLTPPWVPTDPSRRRSTIVFAELTSPE